MTPEDREQDDQESGDESLLLAGNHEWHIDEASGELVGVLIDAGSNGWGYVLFRRSGPDAHRPVEYDLGFADNAAARDALAKAVQKSR